MAPASTSPNNTANRFIEDLLSEIDIIFTDAIEHKNKRSNLQTLTLVSVQARYSYNMAATTIHELRARSVSRTKMGGRASLPIYLCRIPAGFPSPADDYIERSIDLNEWLIRNKLATYIVSVEGDSMAGEIHSGDRLIVDRSLEAKHNDVVVACLNGEMTVKRLLVQDGRRFLVAENPDYPPLELNGEQELIIWGVVTHSIHRLR